MAIKVLPPPPFDELVEKYLGLESDFLPKKEKLIKIIEGVPVTQKGEYYHWNKVRYLNPPHNLSHEEWWLAIKLARKRLLNPLPLHDKAGNAFHYSLPSKAFQLIHEIDSLARGYVQFDDHITNPELRDRYIVSSLIEEAVTSSQLEGATTSRRVAKEMIRSGRKPKDHSEKMILNNYHAMEFVRKHKNTPLSKNIMLELHQIATQGTLKHKDEEGHFRQDKNAKDKIYIFDPEGNILHDPPDWKNIPQRIQHLCNFANGKNLKNEFIHPIVKAIALHFMIGYNHPFSDGNGRTARALFYWSMLSSGYWMCEFLSISSILKKAPSKYAKSFLFTESDENDFTYFLIYQLDVIRRSIDSLSQYLKRKHKEVKSTEYLIASDKNFNYRQIAVLTNALKHSSQTYTIRSHQISHNIAYQTAHDDLVKLVKLDLLMQKKQGKKYVFISTGDLNKKLVNLTSKIVVQKQKSGSN